MSIPRDLRGIAQTLQSQGWRVEPTKKGHYKFIPPNGGPIVTASGTPSDGRARKNFYADLRRSCPYDSQARKNLYADLRRSCPHEENP